MSFPYKHVLLVGATAGIGAAMADRLVFEGVSVTAVGRRQDRLDAFVQKHQSQKATAVPFDVSKTEEAPSFVADVMTRYPTIDCVFLNAGIQKPYNLSNSSKWDLAAFTNEMHVNFTSTVALVHAFLPHLQSKSSQSGFVVTGTHLALVPAASLPAYSASKAALNAFIMSLRDWLMSGSVKVIELWPPPVQTELHDYMGPEGRKLGMPVDKFTDEAYKGLVEGHDHIIVGGVGPPGLITEAEFLDVVGRRQDQFQRLANRMAQMQGRR